MLPVRRFQIHPWSCKGLLISLPCHGHDLLRRGIALQSHAQYEPLPGVVPAPVKLGLRRCPAGLFFRREQRALQTLQGLLKFAQSFAVGRALPFPVAGARPTGVEGIIFGLCVSVGRACVGRRRIGLRLQVVVAGSRKLWIRRRRRGLRILVQPVRLLPQRVGQRTSVPGLGIGAIVTLRQGTVAFGIGSGLLGVEPPTAGRICVQFLDEAIQFRIQLQVDGVRLEVVRVREEPLLGTIE